jgi:uncharacterized damage-inducible protein DinB
MTEQQRIVDQLDRAYREPAWYGPALLTLLKGVTPAQAAKRPIPTAHTIWELVRHIIVWIKIPRERIETHTGMDPETVAEWEPIPEFTAAAWEAMLAELEQELELLKKTFLKMSDAQLNEPVPGKDFSYYVVMQGVVQHMTYHAGQIALLKKMN